MLKMALYRAALFGCSLLMAGCASIERAPLSSAPAATVPEASVSVEARAVASATAAEPSRPLMVVPGAVASAPAGQAAPPAQVASEGANLAKPVVSETSAPAKRVAPAPTAAAPVKARPPTPVSASASESAAAPTPPFVKAAVAPPLDLKSLETRLKETKAIGVFTKLALKNQIDDLLARFRAFYQGQIKISLSELRRSFDMLVLKTLALLQDADAPLAAALASSRESIWGFLSDRTKFATL
jgi:hypothetical protein